MTLELHEPISAIEAKQRAYRRGEDAYRNGLPCDPTQDEEILNYCKYLSIDESAKVMTKWGFGWRHTESEMRGEAGLIRPRKK